MEASTLLGKDIKITIDGGMVYINEAMVTVADIEADNGVVHVIDAVLLPPSSSEINSSSVLNKEFDIYPNPATDFIEISLENTNNINLKLNILNTSGISVLNRYLFDSSSLKISTENLQPGIYFIVISDNETQKIKQLVISR
jgi:hypothetical protein